MSKMKFALLRKSGYVSPYSLAMVYPAYRKSRHYAMIGMNRSDYIAPILVHLPWKGPTWERTTWVQVWPLLVRFPSWVARKVRNLDAGGFVKP